MLARNGGKFVPPRTFISSRAQHLDAVRRDLRPLLRDAAQPVAVVTSLMPDEHATASASLHARFHGATLSSFTSIALDPHPLVAFSLRVPSRMASSLTSAHAAPPAPSHMVVNLLSAAQRDVAVRFSRPDLHPDPFAGAPYSLSAEGLPILAGALGALSCRLVAASWPLHDLESLSAGGWEAKERRVWDGEGVASELFIAQVTRVEQVRTHEYSEEELQTLPLLYHRRAYATTRALDAPKVEQKP